MGRPLVIHDITEVEKGYRWHMVVGSPERVTHSVILDRMAGRRIRKLLDEAKAEKPEPKMGKAK